MSETPYAFTIGHGAVGAMLFDIVRNPCIDVDGKRWSCGPTKTISHARMQRLLDQDYVARDVGAFQGRDMIKLTEKGADELILYGVLRSVEITDSVPQKTLFAANGEDTLSCAESVAFDLAEKAFEIAYLRKKELRPGHRVSIRFGAEGAQVDLFEALKATTKPGERYAIMMGVLECLAEQSMGGLTIGESYSFAKWCASIASVAYARAPQDYADGEPEDDA